MRSHTDIITDIYEYYTVSRKSYDKSLTQLCHQELVEQLQHFKTFAFHTAVQQGFKK